VEGSRSAGPPAPLHTMIELHRLGAHGEPVWLNPDLIATIEAHPDTVVALTTGTKVVVAERIDDVVARIREWRVAIARGALKPSNPATD
jgi:flagellar protein FlbD